MSKYQIKMIQTVYGGLPDKEVVKAKDLTYQDCVDFMHRSLGINEFGPDKYYSTNPDNMGCSDAYKFEKMPALQISICRLELEVERTFVNWYKDRDFPEVKSGNDDVVAVISNPGQLLRVIESHNRLIEQNQKLEAELRNKIRLSNAAGRHIQKQAANIRDLEAKLADLHGYVKGCLEMLPDTEEGSNILAVRIKAAIDRLTELEGEMGAIRTNNLENKERS